MARFKPPYGTTSALASAVVQERDLVYDTSLDRLAIGDGVEAAGKPLAFKSEIDALDARVDDIEAYEVTTYPVGAYGGDIQDAIDAAYAAGGGLVIISADANVSSTIYLKSEVIARVLPGVTLTWTGGSGYMWETPDNDVTERAGIEAYGATFNVDSAADGVLRVHSTWQCSFAGFRTISNNASSVVIDLRADSTGGTNPAAGRHVAYCVFSDISIQGICGTAVRLRGEGSTNSRYVTLNVFNNIGAEHCRVRGVDFAQWCDSNNFFHTRWNMAASSSVGIEFNTADPTNDVGVYNNKFFGVEVDTFAGAFTGRVAVKINRAKDVIIPHLFNVPVAEGGAVVTSASTGVYRIGVFDDTNSEYQILTNGNVNVGLLRGRVTTDTAAVQTLRLDGDRATPANGDTNYLSFYLSDSAGNQDEFARVTAYAEAVTSGAEVGQLRLGVNVLGTLTNKLLLSTSGLVPFTSDGLALGATTAMWSDLFLASGAVVNFNNGDVTLTHASNSLSGAGGQLDWNYNGAAATAPVRSVNATDSNLNVALSVESDRATPAANDRVMIDMKVSDSAGNQDTFARLISQAATVTSTSEVGTFYLALMSAGTLTERYFFANSLFSPVTNDQIALGSGTLSWSDLFLASGAVVNFNNGDVTITHSSDKLTVAGGSLEFPGTTTNDSAGTGLVGEYVSATVASGSAVSLTTDTPANVTSISLTAGDWDVWVTGQFGGGGTTTVGYYATSISTTSATLSTADDRRTFSYGGAATIFGGLARVTSNCGATRVSISSTTTVYMVAQAGFGVSTMNAYGTIHARRVR